MSGPTLALDLLVSRSARFLTSGALNTKIFEDRIADLYATRFANIRGENAQGFEAIVPILKAENFPELRCIGTGFFIHAGGILVTAAHIVREIIDINGRPLDERGLAVIQFSPPNFFQIRWVNKVSLHLVADVAVLCLETIYLKNKVEPLRNKVLIPTTSIPALESPISTWAFPGAIHFASDEYREITITPKVYRGRINQEHRFGRDSVMMPGPCYETTLAIEGGASGGPVFNESGHVFAVNSTGVHGTNIGYASHIQSIGGLRIARVATSDGVIHDNITVSELINRGEISVHDGE